MAFTGEDPYGGIPGGGDGEPGPGGSSGGFAIWFGKTDASHDKGATGTISIYDASDETDTGKNLENVKNYFADLDSDKWVIVVEINSRRLLATGEC